MIPFQTLLLFVLLQVLGNKLLNLVSSLFSQKHLGFHFMYLPIVFLHELGHLIFAIIMLQPIHSFSISFFQRNDTPLGSVAIKPSDSISASFVAIGPLILSMILIILCQIYLYPQISGVMSIGYFFFILILSQVGILSSQDWKVGSKGLIIIACISLLLFVFANNSEKMYIFEQLQYLSQQLNYYYLILCIMNLAAIIFIKVISNATIFHTSPKN